jgi:Ca-activated chloride channel family protein
MKKVRPTTRSALVPWFPALVLTCGLGLPTSDLRANDEADAARTINSANQLMDEGDFDSAIQSLSGIDAPEKYRDEVDYNLGVGYYRQGNLELASQHFELARNSSRDRLARDSRFNLGNCRYSAALETAKTDKPAAIELLKNAISEYRSSLRIDPSNDDARVNIELAAKLIKQLQQETDEEAEQQQNNQKQPQDQQQESMDQNQNENQQEKNESDESQQSQNQQKDNEQQQDSDQPQQDAQPGDSSENEAPDDESGDDPETDSDPRNSSDGSQNDQEQSDSEKRQTANSEARKNGEQSDSEKQTSHEQNQPETGSSSEQPGSDDTSENGDSAGDTEMPDNNEAAQPSQPSPAQDENLRQPSSSDNRIGRDDQNGEPEEPADSETTPTGELKAANEPDQDGEKSAYALSDPNATQGTMTKEEALKMLQAVRDRDMLRRLRLQQRERAKRVPVDKDW